MTQASQRLGAGRWIEPAQHPVSTRESVHELNTSDGAKVSGVLRIVPGARTVVCIMHPRQDVTHHVLVPELLARGFAVWTQGTRSVNNDLSLLHEQALLDTAAGQVFLRSRGFASVVTLGHSGGGTLFAFYHQQASLPAADRLTTGPGGRATGFADSEMPVPDAAVFLAPHPGQGALLSRMIDPSVADESDPLSVVPALNLYDPANGFREPPVLSKFSVEFVRDYRAAQLERIARLDAVARIRLAQIEAAKARFASGGDAADRRLALVPRVLTIYRTDADPRGVDLSLDGNSRSYGSLFGRRPDLTNYGLVGFGRFCTPEAWLSTWSATSTNADFLRCASAVTAPTLLIGLTGDQACFPSDIADMAANLGADDLTHVQVAGTHFGGPIAKGAPTGSSLAAAEIGPWLSARFPVASLAR